MYQRRSRGKCYGQLQDDLNAFRERLRQSLYLHQLIVARTAYEVLHGQTLQARSKKERKLRWACGRLSIRLGWKLVTWGKRVKRRHNQGSRPPIIIQVDPVEHEAPFSNLLSPYQVDIIDPKSQEGGNNHDIRNTRSR